LGLLDAELGVGHLAEEDEVMEGQNAFQHPVGLLWQVGLGGAERGKSLRLPLDSSDRGQEKAGRRRKGKVLNEII